MVREYIIDDSSRHKNPNSMVGKDYSIRVGMVREHVFLNNSKQTRYVVEVWKNNKLFPMTCIRTSRFGGLYNYEEYNHKGFNAGKDNVGLGSFTIVPGDMVIVAAADGESREGIILGCVNHYGRDELLSHNGDIAYISEFNGIQESINKDGEYKRVFKGIPTNIAKLNEAPTGKKYPDAEYDTTIGSSYYEFDKTGSFTLTDNSTSGKQTIKIDKPNGKIHVISGDTSLVIDKSAKSYTIINDSTSFSSTNSFSIKTKATTIDSSDSINAKAANITTEGKWAQKGDMTIEGKIDQKGNNTITGDLKTDGGIVSLAGGANPLIYDIVLTIGVGNLGAPVISNNVVLKTVKTKAT